VTPARCESHPPVASRAGCCRSRVRAPRRADRCGRVRRPGRLRDHATRRPPWPVSRPRHGRRDGVGVLVVTRHGRLARDALVALLIEQAFADAGARILYADGGNDGSDTDRFMRTILHAASEQAKRETVRRLRADRDAKPARDPRAYVGGRPAFGTEWIPRLEGVIDPPMASVVRSIIERARNGESIRAIASHLDAESAGERRSASPSARPDRSPSRPGLPGSRGCPRGA
jgi:hypothetical protein